ncbi:MAG: SDR family NAD(P)-dependent oxidoreductase [Thermodesulfobacteriota bacterium]
MDIKDKKAIVTGGASGIGKSLVEKLSVEGAVVGVFDVNQDALDSLKNEYPDIFCRLCDVGDPRQAEEAVNEFHDKFGAIDILVNNAGIIHNALLVYIEKGKLATYDSDMWDKVIRTNLSSVFYMTSQVAKKMFAKRTRGVIVNIGSICAAGNVGQSAYSAAKAGVSALTVTWAKELGLFGIRVAGVAPGFTETEACKRSMSEEVVKDWVKKTPSRRFSRPDEIADGILFVIRNDAFNGRVLELDGGLRM